MWDQKRCIKISSIKMNYELFIVGSNWHKRMKKLNKIESPKAKRLSIILDKRLNKIVKFIDGQNIVGGPRWYFDKRLEPLGKELRKLKINHD